MNQQPEIALVVLIFVPMLIDKTGEGTNFRSQDRNLHLTRPCIRTSALLGSLPIRPGTHRRRRPVRDITETRGFGREDEIGIVAAESVDAAGDIDFHSVF